MNIKAITGWVLLALPIIKSVLVAIGKPELSDPLDQVVASGGELANAINALMLAAGGAFLRAAPTKKEVK